MFRVSNVQNAGLLRTMGTFKITCGVAPVVFVGVLSLFCFSSCLPCFWVYFGLAFLQVLCWIRVGSILPGQDALFDLFSSVLFVVACWVSVCVFPVLFLFRVLLQLGHFGNFFSGNCGYSVGTLSWVCWALAFWGS